MKGLTKAHLYTTHGHGHGHRHGDGHGHGHGQQYRAFVSLF